MAFGQVSNLLFQECHIVNREANFLLQVESKHWGTHCVTNGLTGVR